ncbi:glutaminase A [Terrabacter aerolatus]|uniref:Glutaminase n=1 Tax=Terrabacter aerolatus TaxID=422442 RepID=A0A512D141_9MICO|nr:glutaminase A [Terrabacter aerolatus]GEO30188.1 glutaminase [Terrabacter aerolatus]
MSDVSSEGVFRQVSTGHLPEDTTVRELLQAAYDQHRHVVDGAVATYIPQLAQADPTSCAASVASVAGRAFEVGDVDARFSIQSVSKPFVLALVVEAVGGERARNLLGANATGLPFDSVMAVELHDHRTMNPMVNAGAIATTSLVPEIAAARGHHGGACEDWDVVIDGLSAFAGRRLDVDEDVYACESGTNLRNRGIAHLVHSHGRLHCDPDLATDLYTRQCSVSVDVHDLAVMAATLADGGVNPLTGERVVSARTCSEVLAVMATAGLYELSGDWLWEVGLPGKSGVSGAVVTVAPGKGGLAVWSPPLDAAGNSVRGGLVTRTLSRSMGLNVFASAADPHVVEPRRD